MKLGPTAFSILSTIQAGGFMICYHDYIGVESLVISGPSMLPTFNRPRLSGDIVLTEGITAWLPDWIINLKCLPDPIKSKMISMTRQFQRGDVVLAYSPIELNKRICKRLIAKEGDIVQVPMDGSALQGKTLIIPEGHVWLEGDCPKVSRDCRDYGPIPQALLHGRPWFQVWPLERFGWIKNKRIEKK
eukprot:g8590.t1